MYGWPSVVDSQGEQSNPTTATVMADTAAVETGVYEVTAVLSTDANAQFQIEHRNAANDAAVSDLVIAYVLANDSKVVTVRIVTRARNERFRVMMQQNLTGNAVASLSVHRVG